MKKNKKNNKVFNIMIIVLVILILVLSIYLIYDIFFHVEGNIDFKLLGSKDVSIYIDTPYYDFGYSLENDFNKDLNEYVTKETNVDTSKLGNYTLTYTLKYKTKKETLTRNIRVVKNEIDDYIFTLKGEPEVYILKNSKYDELGYTCTYNDKELIFMLEPTSNLDVEKEGTYKIEYNIRKHHLERIIHVYDFNITYELNKKEDYKEVVFNYDKDLIKEVVYDNSIIKIDDNKYDILFNGNYVFKFIDKYNNNKEITLNINDIKRNYTCSGTVDRKGTNLEIKGLPSIKIDIKWKLNNKDYSSSDSKIYVKFKKVDTASATINYSNGTSDSVNCTIENNLIYEFNIGVHYVPLSCGGVNTGLNGLLESVVNEAGHGTRAGVVEAARFLQSAVQFAIPYQGKTENNLYKFKGLSSNWGCRASNGYINGMDCVGLFWWPFYQNDNLGDGRGACSNDAVPLKDNLDKIRVGDWVVSYDSEIAQNLGCAYSHGAIIIGIDDDSIYLLSNDLIILDKNALPDQYDTNGSVYLANYAIDGDYTDYWVTDY